MDSDPISIGKPRQHVRRYFELVWEGDAAICAEAGRYLTSDKKASIRTDTEYPYGVSTTSLASHSSLSIRGRYWRGRACRVKMVAKDPWASELGRLGHPREDRQAGHGIGSAAQLAR